MRTSRAFHRRRPTTSGLAVALAVTIGLLAVGACSGSTRSSAGPGTVRGPVVARTGSLEVIHPYLPDPASPSVAAVYLTVRNVGSSPDTLLSVSSPVATSSMLMAEDDDGSTGTMARLADLPIPAHGEVSLVPGQEHVMLENPTALFEVGEHVEITLRFARASPLTVRVPVVPLSAMTDNDGQPFPTSAGSKGMNMAVGGQP